MREEYRFLTVPLLHSLLDSQLSILRGGGVTFLHLLNENAGLFFLVRLTDRLTDLCPKWEYMEGCVLCTLQEKGRREREKKS